jgi:organic radical activating enzyme
MESKGYIEKLKADFKLCSSGAILKITGGEPLIQGKQLLKFIEAFKQRYKFVPTIDFETNATIQPSDEWLIYNATFTTSPKLTSNGDEEEKTYKPEVLKWHVKNKSGFKFVINKSEDIDEIWSKYVTDKEGINIPLHRIWFMPCCGSREEHIKNAPAVAEYAKALNVNFSPRLHLLLWNLALRV